MKIDDSGVTSALRALTPNARIQNAGAKSSGSNSQVDAAAQGFSDGVDLNSRNRIFSDALTAGESARTARIQQLRQIYGSGNNPVSALELSRAILSSEQAGR